MKEKKRNETLVGWGPDGWRCVFKRWFSDFQDAWLIDCRVFDGQGLERWHHGYFRAEFTEAEATRVARQVYDRLA